MTKEPYPSETADRYIVRFPEGMREQIKIAADVNGRSMNAEIVQRLKSTFADEPWGRVYIDFPDETATRLMIEADMNGTTMGEHVIKIVNGAYDANEGHLKYIAQLEKQTDSNADLREQVDSLKKKLERDFVLYYAKVVQLNQFVANLLGTAKEALPENLRKSAEDLMSLSEAEMELLRERYNEGLFWVSRRDNEAQNSRDLAREGARPAPNWDWETSQANAPPPVIKVKSDRAKQQKR